MVVQFQFRLSDQTACQLVWLCKPEFATLALLQHTLISEISSAGLLRIQVNSSMKTSEEAGFLQSHLQHLDKLQCFGLPSRISTSLLLTVQRNARLLYLRRASFSNKVVKVFLLIFLMLVSLSILGSIQVSGPPTLKPWNEILPVLIAQCRLFLSSQLAWLCGHKSITSALLRQTVRSEISSISLHGILVHSSIKISEEGDFPQFLQYPMYELHFL